MPTIAVFGDLSIDTVITPTGSKGDEKSWFGQKSCRRFRRGGSAWLAGSIIESICGKGSVVPPPERDIEPTEFSESLPDPFSSLRLFESLPESFASLRLFPKFEKEKTQVYRLGTAYGWNRTEPTGPEFDNYLKKQRSLIRDVDLLVLTDWGGRFRRQEFLDGSWESILNPKTGIVMLMSSRLAEGNLWQALCDRKALSNTALVVSADCLRGDEVSLAFNASAEQVIMDFRREMEKDDVLRRLVKCRFLVIHFDDGIIY